MEFAWAQRSTSGELERLAEQIKVKNDADLAIAQLIGRPCAPGNIGEFVAPKVFDIRLMDSGAQPGYDGVFEAGTLAGKTVNIKDVQPPGMNDYTPSRGYPLPHPYCPYQPGSGRLPRPVARRRMPAATQRNAAAPNRISWRSQPSTLGLHVQLAGEA